MSTKIFNYLALQDAVFAEHLSNAVVYIQIL